MLLLQVTGCSTDLCNEARIVANTAINFVQTTETTQQTVQTVTEPTPLPVVQQPIVQNTLQTPTFSSIITETTNQKTMEIVLKDQNNQVIGDTVNLELSSLSYFINADYLLDGVSQKADITMTSSDGQSRTMLGADRGWSQKVAGGKRDDGSANFLYRLNSTGEKTITFTVGDTTKTITINVQ